MILELNSSGDNVKTEGNNRENVTSFTNDIFITVGYVYFTSVIFLRTKEMVYSLFVKNW